ncbi:transporter permease [Shewanella sp. Isolate11]|uniref:MMPL family transporter n=1 Tax=Shewanella sp. Isolate11 TaxID=2908530 RepID=UPI001EFDA7A9|nr:transporter permease [Shewanella sp. Isolate11]MCG9697837.1 transporter permease [Shewanella sp. Isolate11]
MIALLRQYLDRLPSQGKLYLWLLLLLTVITLGTLQLQQGAKIQSNILAMLPKISEAPLTQQAIDRVEQQLADRLYFALETQTKAQAIKAAQQLMEQLQAHPNTFTQVTSANSDSAAQFNRFYFPHRFKLLTQEQASRLENDNIAALQANALNQLYNAFGYASSDLLSQDPLLLYPDNLKALAPNQKLHSEQGVLLTTIDNNQGQSKTVAIVMAKGIGSAFSPKEQTQQNQIIDSALKQIKQDLGEQAQLEILKAGALFHASAATNQAKQEVSRLGLASFIGVVLLVWLAFRSILPLFIAGLTIATSLLFAVVSTLLICGELHLLTLVFGTSLIGIAIDYSFHFYCERLNHPKADANETVTRIFAAASLALLTTVLAYFAIGLTPFPGMQQVAIFCGSGLIGAYLTLILAYPKLANSSLRPRPQPLSLASHYLNQLAKLKSVKPSVLLALAILLLLVGSMGLFKLTANDDIRILQKSPAEIVKQEQQLRQLLSGGTDNQFILVQGDNPQQLLQRLESLKAPLTKLQQAGVIGNAVNLASYIPSHETQQRAYQLQGKIYQNMTEQLQQLGLDSTLAPALQRQYQQAQSQFIEASDFFASPAGQMFAPLWLTPDSSANQQQYGAIVLLGGIKDLPQLQAELDPLTNIQLVDKVADISSVMAQYRQLTLTLLALALAIAAAIFSVRFGIKLAALVTAVPAIAAVLTLALLGWFGSPLTLFHALALILVFGIGVDYSLFFAESQQGRGVMMAVFMSACSTLMAFGLLAFSHTPAIHYFGLTLLLGIALTFLLSPLIYTYTRNDK